MAYGPSTTTANQSVAAAGTSVKTESEYNLNPGEPFEFRSLTLKPPDDSDVDTASRHLAELLNVDVKSKYKLNRTNEELKEGMFDPDLPEDTKQEYWETLKSREKREDWLEKTNRKWSDPTTWLADDWWDIATLGLQFLSGRESLKLQKEISDRDYELKDYQFREQLEFAKEKHEWEKYMHGPAITTKNINVFI